MDNECTYVFVITTLGLRVFDVTARYVAIFRHTMSLPIRFSTPPDTHTLHAAGPPPFRI